MSRYLRCERELCPLFGLYRKRKPEEEKGPVFCEEPSCRQEMSEISSLEYLKKVWFGKTWVKLAGAALVVASVLLIAFGKSAPAPSEQALVDLESKVDGLENQFNEFQTAWIKSDPYKTPYREAAIISAEVEKSKEKVVASLNEDKPGEAMRVVNLSKKLLTKVSQVEEEFPKSGLVKSILPERQSLVNSVGECRRLSEDFEREFIPGIDRPFQDRFERVTGRIKHIQGRVIAMSREPKSRKELILSMLESVRTEIRAMEDRLANYVPPSERRPFHPEEASLVFGGEGELCRGLIKPLIEDYARTESFRDDEGNFFIAPKEGPLGGERILISGVGRGGMAELLAGRIQVLITPYEPVTKDKGLFKRRFGRSLRESSWHEVVCSDALIFEGSGQAIVINRSEFAKLNSGAFVLPDPESMTGRLARSFRMAISGRSKDEATNRTELKLFHERNSGEKNSLAGISTGSSNVAVQPSPYTIGSEEYPLSFRINLFSGAVDHEKVKKLVAYLNLNPSQDLINRLGFVDTRSKAESFDAATSEERVVVADALGVDPQDLVGLRRLSSTISFRTNEFVLDRKAERHLETLRNLILTKFSPLEWQFVVVGHTDDVGDDGSNFELSQERADEVANRMKMVVGAKDSGIQIFDVGCGEQISRWDNGTDEGRSKNRRAEIWAAKVKL